MASMNRPGCFSKYASYTLSVRKVRRVWMRYLSQSAIRSHGKRKPMLMQYSFEKPRQSCRSRSSYDIT